MKYSIQSFSAVYGEGSYNSDVYNDSSTTNTNTGTNTGTSTGTAPATGTTQSGGVLANTGFELVVGATIASVIIFSALVVKIWRRPAKKTQA